MLTSAQRAGWRAAAGMKRCAGRLNLEGELTACCSAPVAASAVASLSPARMGRSEWGVLCRSKAEARRILQAVQEHNSYNGEDDEARGGGRGEAWRCRA